MSYEQIDPWKSKPWWCQPWTILLTGVGIISGSWILTKTNWLTVLVALPILLWWTYFLVFWPRLVRSQLNPTQDSSTQSFSASSEK